MKEVVAERSRAPSYSVPYGIGRYPHLSLTIPAHSAEIDNLSGPTKFEEEISDREYEVFPTSGCWTFVQGDEMEFSFLLEQWRAERGITSSTSDMVMCPSYLRIIGMGDRALPLILTQIKREGDDPDHWFTALEAITGEDPVSEDAYGDTVKMAAAWLSWADVINA